MESHQKLRLPYKFDPRAYQLPLFRALDSGVKRAVAIWHRRAGKDKACFNYMVKRAMQRVGTYFYFLPEYAQAKKVIWENIDNDGFRMLDHVPPDLLKKKPNDTELKLELRNGSIIQLIGADKFDKSGVGTNPVGVVFSEYPITRPEIWNFVRPILLANGGWAIFNGTPRGQNHAFNLLEMAKNQSDWFWEILTVDDTGIVTPEQIAKERAEGMTQAMIDQEYYCKFIDNASNFFRRIKETCVGQVQTENPLRFYRMGVDLAKYNDYTSISVIDLNSFEQVYLDRFNQVDWNLQKAKIEAVYYRFGRPSGFIDATGVGDPIVEDLNRRGVALEAYKFTEQSRRDLLTNLAIHTEQDRVKLLDDPVLKAELSYFRYELSDGGKLRIRVPDGLHDDTVFATALSVWELPSAPLRTNRQQMNTRGDGGVPPMYGEFGI